MTAPILASSLAYVIVAAGLRIELTYWPGGGWRQVLGAIRNCFFDVSLILIIALFASMLAYAARDRPGIRTTVQVGGLLVAVLLTLLACINVQAIDLIGAPLTYQWLTFADFLNSHTSRVAVGGAVNEQFVEMVVASLLSFGAIYAMLFKGLRWLDRRAFASWILPCAAALAGAYLLLSMNRLDLPEEDRVYVANPLVELVTTAFSRGTANLLQDSHVVLPPRLPDPSNDVRSIPADVAVAPIRNVLIVVLESVGANYVDMGSTNARRWTPNILNHAKWALNFENVYAQSARTTKSLFSLVTGRAPLFTYGVETQAFEKTQFKSLADRLKRRGFRTAFFGDLQYDHASDFLQSRGFDDLVDEQSLKCPGALTDECLASSALKWIDKRSSPFFLILWTHDTHSPYTPETLPNPGQYSSNANQNRYIAAVRASDESIGALLDRLDRRRLLSTTLVVIMGDHGEAFREHGYNYHSNSIFEEEMHIPVLLINPSIRGRSSATLGAVSDVPQTILHILKLAPERGWDGRSLFDPVRSKRVFMFAPRGPLVGFREGNNKYIYNVARGDALWFDLAKDPLERRDLAHSSTTGFVRRRVSGWLQENDRLLSGSARKRKLESGRDRI